MGKGKSSTVGDMLVLRGKSFFYAKCLRFNKSWSSDKCLSSKSLLTIEKKCGLALLDEIPKQVYISISVQTHSKILCFDLKLVSLCFFGFTVCGGRKPGNTQL